MHGVIQFQESKVSMSDDEKVKHLKYLIEALLPLLGKICKEQIQETKIEANIQSKHCKNCLPFYLMLVRDLYD